MLLLFSVFLIVAGKVGVDFIISDIFKACVLELGFIGEGVAAVALILGAQACTVPSVLCGGRQLWGTKRGKADCRSRPLRFAPRGLRAERPSGRCPVTCLSRAPAWVANPGER